jgi:ABC-type amino acid transport substrate-binding protein
VPGSQAMIDAFNKALAETLEDGSHAAIVKKWDERYNIPTGSAQ